MTDDRLPREHLSPLAASADRALAAFGYEMDPFIEAVDEAVPGPGGLFHPDTTSTELGDAFDRVAASAATEGVDRADAPDGPARKPAPRRGALVLYVDGSSRGNPGPAGAGAVVLTEAGEPLARLGRPVGSNAGNNVAEYAALRLGLERLVTRHRPTALDVRIDSTTVADDVWGGREPPEPFRAYSRGIDARLDAIPRHGWTHLADDDPNPADALATVGADLAALGP